MKFPRTSGGRTKERDIKDHSFDLLRNIIVLETQVDDFLTVLRKGSVATSLYLRRIHNYALDMSWLAWPVLPRETLQSGAELERFLWRRLPSALFFLFCLIMSNL